ncbi:Putative AC transposase [Linum perenne]
MVRDIFGVPISTVPSDSAFSTSGRVLDSFRSSLSPSIVEALICSADWFRSANASFQDAVDLEDLTELEDLLMLVLWVLTMVRMQKLINQLLKREMKIVPMMRMIGMISYRVPMMIIKVEGSFSDIGSRSDDLVNCDVGKKV